MIGSQLAGRYDLLEQLTEDPIFTVYRARDRNGGRDVKVRVIKRPFSDETPFVFKLRQIVTHADKVKHKNLERLHELDQHDRTLYMISQFSEFPSLESRIRRLAQFSVPVALGILIQICEGVQELHKAGYAHGDIRPGTVLSGSDGSVLVLAPMLWESYGHSRTAGVQMLPLMAPYLAPEINAGEMPSQTSDVYSLGILLFQLLAGRLPFEADSPSEYASKHAAQKPAAITSINTSVPQVLQEITSKALAKNPDERYQDAGEMLRDLRKVSEALRFGKTLTWPLDGSTGSRPRVAPKMNVAMPEEKYAKMTEEEEPENDRLLSFLSNMVYVVVALAALVVGGWLFFNLNQPRTVTVPNVVGMSFNEASNELRDIGLTLRIASREENDEVPEGTVLEVNPSPGREAREGGMVDARVSGSPNFTDMPDLRGRSLADARDILRTIGLAIEDPVNEQADRSLGRGLVISQIPNPATRVERGTRVRLTVSSGPPADLPPVERPPRRGGNFIYNLRIVMPANDAPIFVRVEMTDERDTRTIYEREHEPGDEIRLSEEGVGPEAVFRIFFNGELVREVREVSSEERLD